MAASSKPTAVHFSLIFFVMSTLILGVVAFMFHRDMQENAQRQAEDQRAASEAQSTARAALEQVDILKNLLGHPTGEVGQPGGQDATTVVYRVQADIATAGPLAQQNTSATIRKLVEELRQMTAQRDQLQANLDAEHQRLLALQNEYQRRVNEQQQARSTAEQGLQDSLRQHAEQIAQKDKDIDELKVAYQELQSELGQVKDASDKTIKQMDQQLINLSNINNKLRDELEQTRKVSFERPDGVVRLVDNTTGKVWITLGEADNLPLKTTFSVYSRASTGVARGAEDIKGSIEVTRILGPHLAEAQVLHDDIYNPISAEDPIYTPLWTPGQIHYFSFIGLMDLDNDGRDDREVLREFLEQSGARIDNDVDMQGNRTGNGITVNTKFLVIGDIPDLASTTKPEEQTVIQNIVEHLKDMRREAREQGVRIINLSDFLAFVGYKPRNRVFRPGDDRPYNLNFGSRGPSTDASLTPNRVSTGQTSGAYSGKNGVSPKRSSGQTSKTFRSTSGGSGY